MTTSLADVLGCFIQREHTSINRLATLSGVPKKTITNWLEGKVRRPQQWQSLIMVAAALHVTEGDANTLLVAAGYPPLAELRTRLATETERCLFAVWSPPPTGPFQAIARLPYFVGRDSELYRASREILHGQHIAFYNLHGMGGVGKTTLAAQLAYQLRPHFPDGVLWARLDTTDTLTTLSAFASAYGQDVSRYTDLDSRGSAVRAILADKRVLIVLDNAQSSAQVRPLLPPTTGKPAVIVTTRYELEVIAGWPQLAVESFDPHLGDTLALFEKLIGSRRTKRHQATILEIGQLLGHLPLALALIASRLATQPDRAIPDFVERLHRDGVRLDELAREDRSVRLTFDISYEQLLPEQQQFFAALGAIGGEDFSLEAAAYVTETDQATARDQLENFQRLSLIQLSRLDRYQLHPLLRDYARERALQGGQYRHRLERLLEFMIQAARQTTQQPGQSVDMTSLYSALYEAYHYQLTERAVEAVDAFMPIWLIHGSYALAQEQTKQALEAAARLPDKQSQVRLLLGLGTSEIALGNWHSGQTRVAQALELAYTHAQLREVADALRALGKLAFEQGNWSQSIQAHQQSLSVARQIDDLDLIGRNLNNLGLIALAQCDYVNGEALLEEALDIFRRAGLRMAEGVVLANLGQIYQVHGDLSRAEDCYRTGLSIVRTVNSPPAVIFMSINVTDILLERGQLVEAEALMREAVTVARDINLRRDEGMALWALAQVLGRQGRVTEAVACGQAGLAIARAMQDRENEARAWNVLGDLSFRQGQHKQAQAAWREALTLAETLGNKLLQAESCFGLAQLARAQREIANAERLAHVSSTLLCDLQHWKAKQVLEWLVALRQDISPVLEQAGELAAAQSVH